VAPKQPDEAHPVAPKQAVEVAPPLEIRFKSAMGTLFIEDYGVPSCGVPKDRQQSYDPQTGVFHIHFKSGDGVRCAFEVTKIDERSTKPIVFRLTGVPLDFGCLGRSLALIVGDKVYDLEDGRWAWRPVDKTLCRVERKGEQVTVAFTQKGRALLKPGAQIGFTVDCDW
jgi:hypothetical protein